MCWYLPCSPRNSPSTVCNRRTIGGIKTPSSAAVPLRALRKSFPLTGLDDIWTENPQQEVPERLSEQCLSGGSCRLRAPTAHWFPGTLSERNWKLHIDEDKLGPGTAWKFSRASRPSLLTVCSRRRHGECRIRGLHPLSAGGEELLLLIILAGY